MGKPKIAMSRLSVIVLLATLCLCTAKITRTVISTPDAPPAIGPYSQAIVVQYSSGEGMIYVAGQIGMNATGALVPGGIQPETAQLFENINAILKAGGSSLAEVVECNCVLADLNEYAQFNVVYAKYFSNSTNLPVRAAFQVSALPKGARAEVKCTATRES